jgi:hypothetical protein
MHSQYLIMMVALAVALGIPFYALRRKRAVFAGLNAFVAERKFVTRSNSPVAAFSEKNPPGGLYFSSGYDGELRPNVPITLMLLRRTEAVSVSGSMVQNQTLYVGVYLRTDENSASRLLKAAQEKSTSNLVVYAAHAQEGGVAIVWRGAPSRSNIEAHLTALSKLL